MTAEQKLKVILDILDEVADTYVETAEYTFGRPMKRTGLLFKVLKTIRNKYTREYLEGEMDGVSN